MEVTVEENHTNASTQTGGIHKADTKANGTTYVSSSHVCNLITCQFSVLKIRTNQLLRRSEIISATETRQEFLLRLVLKRTWYNVTILENMGADISHKVYL